jgi:hypothetical protein
MNPLDGELLAISSYSQQLHRDKRSEEADSVPKFLYPKEYVS